VERLARLGEIFGLSLRQQGQLACLLDEVTSDAHAPTAIREWSQAVDGHLADSLVALDVTAVRAATKIADIGSGAGFPGLPLAVALPAVQLSLVESQARRCSFLRRLCVKAGLENADVVCSRVEQWVDGQGANDVVVARALAPAPVVLEYAAPLLRVGGMIVDWRGDVADAETEQALRAAEALGLALAEVRKVTPFASARARFLHLYLKVRATPERFPRRAGMALKRPLAGKGTVANDRAQTRFASQAKSQVAIESAQIQRKSSVNRAGSASDRHWR
jgi:16S rRNA (guanine527-N7)-methyltransferase